MDTTTRSTTYINKSTTYDVSLHALYDDTVVVNNAMPPGGNTFVSQQAWDDTPTGLPVVERLFEPEGADVLNQVLFLLLHQIYSYLHLT